MSSAEATPSSVVFSARSATRRSSLTTGLRILDCVVERGQLRVSDISELVGLPLSTTHRYVRQLRESGYLQEVDGYYSCGRRTQADPQTAFAGHIVRLADTQLRRLVSATGEAAVLTVRVQTAALCLDRIMPSQRRYVLSFHRGTVRPLYAGASARVLLAHAPEQVVGSVVNSALRRFTADTLDAASLPLALSQTREQGFALSCGEVDPQMVAVAAPSFRGATCVCALSVVGAQARLSGERLDSAIAEVVGASTDLSERLRTVSGASAWVPGDDL